MKDMQGVINRSDIAVEKSYKRENISVYVDTSKQLDKDDIDHAVSKNGFLSGFFNRRKLKRFNIMNFTHGLKKSDITLVDFEKARKRKVVEIRRKTEEKDRDRNDG